MKGTKVILGCDHGGFELKEKIKKFLIDGGYEVQDEGALKFDSQDDYVDYAFKVARKVGAAEAKKMFQEEVKGVLFCRSAAGMVMAANKVKGARAAAAFDETSSKHSREHNAANILALSGDWMDAEKAKKILRIWLETPFGNEERHARRIRKITEEENANGSSC